MNDKKLVKALRMAADHFAAEADHLEAKPVSEDVTLIKALRIAADHMQTKYPRRMTHHVVFADEMRAEAGRLEAAQLNLQRDLHIGRHMVENVLFGRLYGETAEAHYLRIAAGTHKAVTAAAAEASAK